MKLINLLFRKNKASIVFIFSLMLLLNFCGVQSLALSFECDTHYDSSEEAHTFSHEENHSKDATDSYEGNHEDEEDPFCCSTIKAVSITLKQNLTFDFLKDFSDFSDNSTLSVVAEVSQLSEIWKPFHYLGPPGADRFKIAFLITSPTHAPPIPCTI